MFPCPWCKKPLPGLVRECPSCHADLSLIISYVSNLAGGLAKAEAMTRRGELDAAVWAYLEILDVDPENAVARQQVGRVAAAVRQFDESSPNRNWLGQQKYPANIFWVILVLAALIVGFLLGQQMPRGESTSSSDAESSAR